MTKPSIGLNDSESLDRLMTRRDIARIGAAGVFVGRTHDHLNLFLAGGGLFPTIGTANPTLTIAALALRTAAAIETDLGIVPGTPLASPVA